MSIKEQLEKELNYTDFDLEFEEDKTMIKLTIKNVQKVETMLRYNPDYPQFVDYEEYINKDIPIEILDDIKKEKERNSKKTDEDKKYKYSSVYYIKALRKYKDDEDLYPYLLNTIIRKVNSENSTRGSLDNINTISDNIASLNYDELIKELKDQKNYEIIKYFCPEKSDHYLSLATKFCHYMSFTLFCNTDDADLYSIFDRVVNNNLEKYAKRYGITFEKKELKDLKSWEEIKKYYQDYQDAINEILNEAEKLNGERISRNGFDHLIWYSSKNK